MKTNHTPGPYSISGTTGDHHIMATVGRERRAVAIVLGWPDISPAEHGANVALFRQAPTLLAQRNALRAALEKLMEFEIRICSCDHDGGYRAMDQARAAINSSKD